MNRAILISFFVLIVSVIATSGQGIFSVANDFINYSLLDLILSTISAHWYRRKVPNPKWRRRHLRDDSRLPALHENIEERKSRKQVRRDLPAQRSLRMERTMAEGLLRPRRVDVRSPMISTKRQLLTLSFLPIITTLITNKLRAR